MSKPVKGVDWFMIILWLSSAFMLSESDNCDWGDFCNATMIVIAYMRISDMIGGE
jgi:hypothetical protein